MQVGAQALKVQFTLHEATEVPSKPVIHPPRDFAATTGPVSADCKKLTAYVLGAGPNGTNGTQSFWMSAEVAQQFEAAVGAALKAGNYYAIGFAR